LSRIRQCLGKCGLPEKFNKDTWEAFKDFSKEGDDDDWLDFVERFEWATETTHALDIGSEIQSELLESGFATDEEEARAQHEAMLVFVLRLLCQKGIKRVEAKAWKQTARAALSVSDRVLLDQVAARQVEVESRLANIEGELGVVKTQLEDFSIETRLTLNNHETRIGAVETNQVRVLQAFSTGHEVAQDKLDILTAQLRTKTAEEIRNSPQARVWEMEIQIEETRKLLNNGKFQTGQKRLEELQGEARSLDESHDKPRLESRIKGLLAFCAWRQDDLPKADRLFYESYVLQRSNAARVANAAFGKLLLNQPEEAFRLGEEALALDAAHDDALSMVVRALHLMRRGSEIDSWLQKHPQAANGLQTLFVRGGIAIETGDYPTAQQLARDVRALAPENPLAHRLFCDAHFIPLQQEFIHDPPILFQLTDTQQRQLEFAEEAANTALDLMKGWEVKTPQIEALVARAGIRELLGHTDKAIADCDLILEFDPDDESGHFMKGEMLLHRKRDLPSAIAHLSRVRAGKMGEDACVLQAEAHVEAKEWTKAIEVLEPHYKPDASQRSQMDLARLLLQAAYWGGDVARVQRFKADLETLYPDDTVALVTLSDLARWQGDGVQAVELMQKAFDRSQGARRERARFLLSQARLSNGDFTGAATTLEPLVNLARPDVILRSYLEVLMQSGQAEKAASIALKVRGGGRAVRGVSEYEANGAVEEGNAPLARQLLDQLSEDHPDDVLFARNAAAMWLFRSPSEIANPESGPSHPDRIEAARVALKRISFEAVKDNPAQLMDLARLHFQAGLANALEMAYRALRLAPADGGIGGTYIQLISSLPEEQPGMGMEEVQDECAVEVKPASAPSDSEPQTWIITRKAMGGANEIAPDHPLAQKLRGKKVGDRVQLDSISSVGEKEGEIIRVRSKYVHALNETMRLFSTGVLSHTGLVVGNFASPEETVKQEREKLRALLDEGSSIEKLYEFYAVSVSTLAQMTGRIVPDLWRVEGGYSVESEGHFFAAEGTEKEILQHHQIATNATGLALDWTALLSVVHLRIEDAIAARFKRLVMPRALADEVAVYARRSSSPSALRESDSQTARRDLSQRLEKFVREKCEVVEVNEWDATDIEVAKTYGRSTVATLKLTVQEQLPLFADDLRLRARFEVVPSVGIQWILLNLREKQHLNNDAYFEAVRTLIYAGYGFIWASIPFFMWVLRRNKHEVTDDVQAILQSLSYWKTVEPLVVALSAGFLSALWKEQLSEPRRRALVEAVLDASVKERHQTQVIQMFQEQLIQTLADRPALLVIVLADVAWWWKRQEQAVRAAGLLIPDELLL
jgi:tetratricopeptide (TPR) repeat protein